MNYLLIERILKYIDCFGTNFTFYIEKNRKLHTPFGGILTLLSLIVGALIFISMNIDELKHDNPISATSVIQENYHNIKFIKEKIWIPWRVRDYEGNLANFTGLLYPIIYYYYGIRNKEANRLDLGYSFLKYKLCNETSMINNTDSFILGVSLDQLYCIDMEDLDMGGNWDYDFVNYVEFDLYTCKNGIDYDENNINCTSYEKLIEAAEKDNSFEFEIYYPLVNYQPMNKTNPIFVKYISYFYHLSRFSNKIDRLYLQKYILKDDRGWISKNEKITRFWGCQSFSGDSYATGDKKDLMSEGSSSRLYSFNIYINFEVIFYSRAYKNLFLVIADGLPIVYIIFMLFKFIAKIIKISSGNKKLTELLFENLQEKTIRSKKNKINDIVNNKKQTFIDKKFDNKNQKISKFDIANNNNREYNNISEFPFIKPGQKDLTRNIFKDFNEEKNSIESKNKLSYSKNSSNRKSHPNKAQLNNLFSNNIGNGNSLENNNLNFNLSEFFNDKTRDILSQSSNTFYKNNLYRFNDENKIVNGNKILTGQKKKLYIQKKLFPYKYYLCSIFIGNIDLKKKSCFFTRKFLVVYNFICQLFDISSYLMLQKEFQIMKNTIMIGKYKDILETNQKINVNTRTFNVDMKECIDSNKFSILGRVKETKEDI